MIENLIAYEMAGQRRCIAAPAGWKIRVGGGEECHIRLSGDQVPEVMFSLVRDGAGGIQVLDENDQLLQEASLPFESELLGMPFVLFEPGRLLESPFAVDASPRRALVLRSGEDIATLQVPPGELLCAGCAADADIVLPAGPNYAYVLWWDGSRRVHLAVLDSSEGAAWRVGDQWSEQEGVTLPTTLLAGEWQCELESHSAPKASAPAGNPAGGGGTDAPGTGAQGDSPV